MKTYVLILLLIVSIPLCLKGQSSDPPIFRGAEAYISYGLHFMPTSSLNNDLKKYDLPDLSPTQMGIGAGGGVFLKRFYFGGQGVVQLGSNDSNDLYQTKLIGGYGMVQGGYALVQKPSVTFYPTLGLGGGGSLLSIKAGPSYTENRGELEPGNNLHTNYMLIDIGVNSDFFVGAERASTKKFLIGVSAGYQLHPYIKGWSYKDQDVPDISKFAPSGFYIKVKAGLGYFR